ncbi:MAG: CpXC domain-containing protein [Atopobiaceae bacterium]|nr:CpXC domain-containing protein [Atopobiaceae bacterium]MCI2172739.1 CpXC domain-containing protein [Atopobiaceae bacterium]MCI2207046.1 CpXC domain-containing protein [Atopobiaceae bacterium]
MDSSKTIDFVCPTCGAHEQVDCWESLTAEREPDAAKQLLAGTLFRHACASCGAICELDHSLLYKDLAHRAMVYYLPGADEAARAVEQFRRLDEADAATDAPKHLVRRVVTTHADLAEKARVLFWGLDDRVIEVLKPVGEAMIRDQHPGIDVSGLTFEGVRTDEETGDGEKLAFEIHGSQTLSIDIPREYYDNIVADDVMRSRMEGAPSYVIDRDWAMGVVEVFDAE